MSDVVLLRDDKDPFFPKIFDSQQEALNKFLSHTLKLVRETKTGQLNYKTVVARLKHNADRLEAMASDRGLSTDWDKFRNEVCANWNNEKDSLAGEGDTLAEAMRIELAAQVFFFFLFSSRF